MNCILCGNPVAEFVAYGVPARRGLCPHCGAKPRNRALYFYLRAVVQQRLDAASEVLEVGASRIGLQVTSSVLCSGGARYTVIDTRQYDYHSRIVPPHRVRRMDVSSMDFPDDTFDVIVCSHTLPYVRNDRAALAEIFRCLRVDGLAMLDSPCDALRTLPVETYRRQHPHLDDAYFAENGDQWVYGRDYAERLRSAGFTLRVDAPFDDKDHRFKREHGLKDRNEFFIGFKSPAGDARFPFPPAPLPQDPG